MFKRITLSGLTLYLIVVFVTLSGSGCSKGVVLEFSPIRKFPNSGLMEKFVEKTHFQATDSPNIYFVFFDSLRPDLALQHGAFKSFYDRNITFKTSYASGTATWYSMFSFFHSVPGFLAYDAVPSERLNTDEYGSLYLKILQKLGYKIDIYGYGWNCVPKEFQSGSSWNRFLISFFGWKTRILDRCQSDVNYDEKFLNNKDEITVTEIEKKLPSVVTSPDKHLSMLTFFNNHSPYKWGNVTGVSENVGRREDFSSIRTTINRYSNSVIASDVNFERVMRLIDSLPGHEDSIVVLFSDHGEMLYEKKHESGHGGVPYKEKIEILLSFQFPDKQGAREKSSSRLASIADVLPTVFDFMKVSPEVPSEWITGQSLLSHSRNSTLVVQSNQENPTREMVLVNQFQKAWIEVEEKDFYHSRSFRLTKVTDLDDRSQDNFCDNKTPDECRQLLFSLFPEAMRELYPDLGSSPVGKTNSDRR